MELIFKDKIITSKKEVLIINPFENFDDLDS